MSKASDYDKSDTNQRVAALTARLGAIGAKYSQGRAPRDPDIVRIRVRDWTAMVVEMADALIAATPQECGIPYPGNSSVLCALPKGHNPYNHASIDGRPWLPEIAATPPDPPPHACEHCSGIKPWVVLRYQHTWDPEVEEATLFDDKSDAEKYVAQSSRPGDLQLIEGQYIRAASPQAVSWNDSYGGACPTCHHMSPSLIAFYKGQPNPND
jgi:hypothetical protein